MTAAMRGGSIFDMKLSHMRQDLWWPPSLRISSQYHDGNLSRAHTAKVTPAFSLPGSSKPTGKQWQMSTYAHVDTHVTATKQCESKIVTATGKPYKAYLRGGKQKQKQVAWNIWELVALYMKFPGVISKNNSHKDNCLVQPLFTILVLLPSSDIFQMK